MAAGTGGRFWDLDEEEATATLAVVLHRRTSQGSRSCVLPACSADLAEAWNATRPRKKQAGPSVLPEAWETS